MGRVAKNPSLAACYAEIAANPGKTYVYVIKRSNGEPFYVGMGINRRIGCHQVEANNLKRRGPKVDIIRTNDVIYEIVGWFDERDDAVAEEMRLIAEYGRRDIGTGILTNCTVGGDGVIGREYKPVSAETRAKQSASAKARPKDSFNLTGLREWHEEHRDVVSSQQSARWEDPEYRKRLTASLAVADRDFTYRQDPEYRQNISNKAKERWADPVFKASVVAKVKATKAAKKAA